MQDPVESENALGAPVETAPGPSPTSPGTRLGLWFGLAILFIPLIVYILTLCPTVFVGDAGDFITASFTLGIPHPPGYPLYTLLGWLFIQLPIPGGLSSAAFRMNLLSAVSAWAACVFLFLFLRRVLHTEWAAIAGALVLAFSRQFWEHAEIAEVYALQICFLTLTLYLAVLYVQEKKVGWALLLAFIMGLAMSHQYAVLLFYPGILIFIGMNGGFRLRWYTWLLAIFLALFGLAPYAYLPLVNYKTPLGEVIFVESDEQAAEIGYENMAVTQNPWGYFWDYFSRRHYSKSRVYTHSEEAMPDRTTTPMVLRKTAMTTEEDFGTPLLLFGLLAWIVLFVSLLRKSRPPATGDPPIPRAAMLPPALGYICYFLVVHFYASGDILGAPIENLEVVAPPLLIPLQAALAAIIAFGFDTFHRWIAAYIRSQGESNLAASQKFKTFAGLLVIAAFSLVFVNAWRNSEYGDKSQAIVSYNYALNVLDSCDPDAILLTTGDETFLYWYVQNCEPARDPDDPLPGYRKDVLATNWIHNLQSLEVLADEPSAMREVTELFIARSTYYRPYTGVLLLPDHGPRPINTTFIASSFAESDAIMGLDVILQGLTYSFRTPGDVPDLANPKVRLGGNLDRIEEGAAPLLVIDYFDARPFQMYRWEGLPRFEGLSDDLSNLDTALYVHVNLEAQETEVLGRYQDALYRFGIQALLEDTPESVPLAVSYLFQCVSLDPDSWFGWKELGDAFFANGRLDSAVGAYRQLIEIATVRDDVDPALESSAHAQLGHIELIRGNHADAEREATLALVLNPNSNMARAVLDEIDRQRSLPDDDTGDAPAGEDSDAEPTGGTPDESDGIGELREFDQDLSAGD